MSASNVIDATKLFRRPRAARRRWRKCTASKMRRELLAIAEFFGWDEKQRRFMGSLGVCDMLYILEEFDRALDAIDEATERGLPPERIKQLAETGELWEGGAA